MKTIGIDVETTMAPRHFPWVEGAYLVSVGIAEETGETHTWTFNHKEVEPGLQDTMIKEIQEMVDQADRIVGHNLKFDLNWLKVIGINVDCRLFCTMVAEYLIRGQKRGELSLHDLSIHYNLPAKQDQVKVFWDAGIDTPDIPLRILDPYLRQDCLNTLALFQRQSKVIMKMGLGNVVKIQQGLTRYWSNIETNGMKFNKKTAYKHISDMSDRLAVIDTDLKMAFGWDVNINSGDELSVALYGGVLKRKGTEWVTRELKDCTKYYERNCIVETRMQGVGFDPPKGSELKKGGYYSTDKNTIKNLKAGNKTLRQVKKLLLERSAIAKALETFVGSSDEKGLINKVQEDGCLHAKYNQTVTRTGRPSSSDPNGQNLPRGKTSPIKQCIEPRFDWIMAADMSQIEWRVAAWLSQDPVMMDEIKHGVDAHADNAINFFKAVPGSDKFDQLRTDAKIMTFRLIYGGSAYGFFKDEKMPRFPLPAWEKIVRAFWSKYKVLRRWQLDNIRFVNANNGKLVSPTGRIFWINKDKKGGYSQRQTSNYPVQSLATADIMPLAMILIGIEMEKGCFRSIMIGQVHDSIIFDVVDEEKERLARLCVKVFRSLPSYLSKMFRFDWNVPLDGDIELGRNYGQMEKFKKF